MSLEPEVNPETEFSISQIFKGAHEDHEERIIRLKKDFGMSFSSFVLFAFFVVV